MKTADIMKGKFNPTNIQRIIAYHSAQEASELIYKFASQQRLSREKIMKTRIEEIVEILQKELWSVFQMGLKQSPFDGDNSNFYAPLIYEDIAPRIATEIAEGEQRKDKMIEFRQKITDGDIEEKYPTDLRKLCEIHDIPIKFNADQGGYLSVLRDINLNKQEGAKAMRDNPQQFKK